MVEDRQNGKDRHSHFRRDDRLHEHPLMIVAVHCKCSIGKAVIGMDPIYGGSLNRRTGIKCGRIWLCRLSRSFDSSIREQINTVSGYEVGKRDSLVGYFTECPHTFLGRPHSVESSQRRPLSKISMGTSHPYQCSGPQPSENRSNTPRVPLLTTVLITGLEFARAWRNMNAKTTCS